MSVRINISPAVLEWAIEEIQEITPPIKALSTLKAWQVGLTFPTYAQIKKVSSQTHIPFGYFFLSAPPEEEIPLMQYRTFVKEGFEKPSRDVIDTIDDMQGIVDWTEGYMIDEGFEPNVFVGSLKETTDWLNIADTIRNALDIPLDWFRATQNSRESFNYIRSKIQDLGILVMMNGTVRDNIHRVLSVEEFRAFTLINDYAPLIFINARDSDGGRLFSLLHELVHVFLGENNLYNAWELGSTNQSKIETLCNSVAAEILVPQQIFVEQAEYLLTDNLEESIEKLAKYFTSSRLVVARRALDLGWIDQESYESIAQKAIEQFNERKNKKAKGGNYYHTKKSRIDFRLLEMLTNSLSQGKTTYVEAFRLTHTNQRTFFNLIENV